MDAERPKRQQRRLIACMACRLIRIRCVGNESQRDPCDRCRRLNISCVYARKRRRVKNSAAAASPVEAAPAPRSAPANNHATVGYLDPELAPAPDSSSGDDCPGASDDDPIAMDLLSSVEASHLCMKYMRHLNPLIALLDPQLHTFDYIRGTSSALLSAVLMCAAKFFRPRLHLPLLTHTRTLVNRATSTGNKCDLGMVQALALMVAWKEPSDPTSGVKLAIAIRLGYQLGLHIARTTPLPEDVHEARVIADGERTWFILSCFDRIYSDVFGLPHTMRLEELPNCVRWAEETNRFHGGDMRHACSMSSASTYTMLIRLRRTHTTMPREMAWALLNDIYNQMQLHLTQWFPDDQSQGKFSPFEQSVLKWFDLNHLMRIKFLMLDVCPDHQRDLIVADWLQMANSFTAQTELIAELGCLAYMQDTSATHLSSFGVVGHKMCARISPLQRELVMDYIRRMSACCDRARSAAGNAVMDIVGRFLKRLLDLLSTEAQIHEAEQLQNPVGAFDLDEFLRHALPPTGGFDQGSVDDQFWSMLFPEPGV